MTQTCPLSGFIGFSEISKVFGHAPAIRALPIKKTNRQAEQQGGFLQKDAFYVIASKAAIEC
jgi:hypothetical protein